MEEEQLSLENYAEAAKMIAELAASQIRNAVDLGKCAVILGLDSSENPYINLYPNKDLENAWSSGWVMETFKKTQN